MRHCCQHSRRCGEVGDQRHLGEAVADRAQRGPGVEPEPAQPQDQHAEADERHRVSRDRPRLAVGPVLADPRSKQQQGGERSCRSDQVDHRRSGEVLHPDVHLQPSATEDPVADDRVDHGAEHDRVDHVRAVLDPFQRGAPHDCQRHRAEHELEEQERRRADVVGLQERELLRRLSGHRAHVEEEPRVPRDRSRAAEGEREPHRPVGKRGDREVGQDLRHPGAGVLHAREPDLQESESRLHEHHEHRRHDHPGGVQARGDLFDAWAHPVPWPRPEERAAQRHRKGPPSDTWSASRAFLLTRPGRGPGGRSYGTLARLGSSRRHVFGHRSEISGDGFSLWSSAFPHNGRTCRARFGDILASMLDVGEFSAAMRTSDRPRDRVVAELAARQHGVVAHRQLRELGLAAGTITRAGTARRLHRLHEGVYVVGHRCLPRHAREMAAVFACGATALLSHRSAAASWV